jgi:hypothetical protein
MIRPAGQVGAQMRVTVCKVWVSMAGGYPQGRRGGGRDSRKVTWLLLSADSPFHIREVGALIAREAARGQKRLAASQTTACCGPSYHRLHDRLTRSLEIAFRVPSGLIPWNGAFWAGR